MTSPTVVDCGDSDTGSEPGGWLSYKQPPVLDYIFFQNL